MKTIVYVTRDGRNVVNGTVVTVGNIGIVEENVKKGNDKDPDTTRTMRTMMVYIFCILLHTNLKNLIISREAKIGYLNTYILISLFR